MGKFVDEHLIGLRVNGTKGEGKELRKKYEVRGFPTVLFLNGNGDEIDRIFGYSGNKEATFETIQDYAQGKNTLVSYQAKIAQDPDNIELNFKLAQKHSSRWEAEQAKLYFEKVLKLDPADSKGFKTESVFNLNVYKARYKQNVEPLQNFMDKNTDEKYFETGYSNLLRCYSKAKDQDKVVATYEAAVNKMASNHNIFNAYAWFIYEEKLAHKYDRGIELAKKAVKLKPDAAHIWDTLAWLQFEKGNKKAAIKAMKKAVEIAPEVKGYNKNLEKMEQSDS
ncbi:hypothetical protein B6I21_09145 [candidate division KSB1 bacterium 4572_119]|nr:MAG: hypothetical protein B6I21_09145 [candidate division KSB1 bacterium 4572_119]